MAYRAVQEHFAESNEPALLQVPVGCGKTGLISILPFGIASSRVLIVAPNLTIRDALFEAVDCVNRRCFFRSQAVAPMTIEGPFAAKIDGRDANLADCNSSHFVVTNVQQIGQSGNRWLDRLPSSFFDMILFDEGHHNAAKSWQRLIEHFPDAKLVSLTATPFRSDGRQVTGKLIYRYSLLRAMRRGYIKTLEAVHVAPSELAFTFRDSQETATLQEVLKLRDEVWFSRGVAQAEQCNRSIVDASIRACEELRQSSQHRQQIIAAAGSVEHAEMESSIVVDIFLVVSFGELDRSARIGAGVFVVYPCRERCVATTRTFSKVL
jgi:superfamily II DNA or RNA helicase